MLTRQFRHDAEGRLLRATETGTPGHLSVGAQVCQLEAPSGLYIRVTAEAATLPAAAASTDLQPAIALQCSDSESDDDEVTDGDAPTVTDQGKKTGEPPCDTPAAVAAAKAREYTGTPRSHREEPPRHPTLAS